LLARGGRFLVAASVLLLVASTIGGYLLGRDMARRPLEAATQLIQQIQPESQKLKATILSQNATITELEAQLKKVQAALNAIMPSENTYRITANRSMIVAGGRLTIGLIGPPTNETVNININGKQHSAVTGDVFEITPDSSTTCQIRIQAFDMFEVILTASCAAAKAQ
jgi:hypothetical protein